MKRHPVAGTYARALMEIGAEKGGGKADEIFEELDLLEKDVLSDAFFRVFFESPKIPREEKKKVLEKALSGKVCDEVLNLLRILIDRGRQMLLDQIYESYSELYDDFKRRAHVRIDSAVELSTDKRSRLAEVLGKKLDREIIMTERIDTDLLGGMTIRFGDTVIDGSIRTQLNKVRDAISSQRLGSDLIHED